MGEDFGEVRGFVAEPVLCFPVVFREGEVAVQEGGGDVFGDGEGLADEIGALRFQGEEEGGGGGQAGGGEGADGGGDGGGIAGGEDFLNDLGVGAGGGGEGGEFLREGGGEAVLDGGFGGVDGEGGGDLRVGLGEGGEAVGGGDFGEFLGGGIEGVAGEDSQIDFAIWGVGDGEAMGEAVPFDKDVAGMGWGRVRKVQLGHRLLADIANDRKVDFGAVFQDDDEFGIIKGGQLRNRIAWKGFAAENFARGGIADVPDDVLFGAGRVGDEQAVRGKGLEEVGV